MYIVRYFLYNSNPEDNKLFKELTYERTAPIIPELGMTVSFDDDDQLQVYNVIDVSLGFTTEYDDPNNLQALIDVIVEPTIL